MTPALRRKLDALVERREEVERLLADPAVAADQARFRNLSREFATLQPVADALAPEAQARATAQVHDEHTEHVEHDEGEQDQAHESRGGVQFGIGFRGDEAPTQQDTPRDRLFSLSPPGRG